MRVTNINGTQDNVCRCGSWIEHWKNYSNQPLPVYCPVAACMAKPEVGAHVQREDSSDGRWYIIPLCNAHNHTTDRSLEVSNNLVLVSANVGQTCG